MEQVAERQKEMSTEETPTTIISKAERAFIRAGMRYGFAKMLGMFPSMNDISDWEIDPLWDRRDTVVLNEGNAVLMMAENLVRAMAGAGSALQKLGPMDLSQILTTQHMELAKLEEELREKRELVAGIERALSTMGGT
jgi:hypothetical protein